MDVFKIILIIFYGIFFYFLFFMGTFYRFQSKFYSFAIFFLKFYYRKFLQLSSIKNIIAYKIVYIILLTKSEIFQEAVRILILAFLIILIITVVGIQFRNYIQDVFFIIIFNFIYYVRFQCECFPKLFFKI